MVIILEGADLVGKTTLAKKLGLELGIPQTGIWIDLNYPQPSMVSVSKTLKMVIQALQPNIIFDRSFLSEWVHSKIINREHDYINELIAEWGKIDDLFLVITYANDNVLKGRFDVRGDERFSINHILKANVLYQELYSFVNNHITSILLDVSESTVEQTVGHIVKFIHNQKHEIIKSNKRKDALHTTSGLA